MILKTLTTSEARPKRDETSHRDAPFKQTREALELGKRYLGSDNAYLARIDAEVGYWETAVSADAQDERGPEGFELDFQRTYCRRTFESDGPITLYSAPVWGWDNNSASETQGFHCSHGSTLDVDGEPSETLCSVVNNPVSHST